jgi:hypothetical protein
VPPARALVSGQAARGNCEGGVTLDYEDNLLHSFDSSYEVFAGFDAALMQFECEGEIIVFGVTKPHEDACQRRARGDHLKFSE